MAEASFKKKEESIKEDELRTKEYNLLQQENNLKDREASLQNEKLRLLNDIAAADNLYPQRFSIEASGQIGYWYISDNLAYAQARLSFSLLHRFDIDKRKYYQDNPTNRFGVQYGIQGVFDGSNNLNRFLPGYMQDISAILDLRESVRFQIGRGIPSNNQIFDRNAYWLLGMSYFFNLNPIPISLFGTMIGDSKLFQNTFVLGLSIGYGNSFLRW